MAKTVIAFSNTSGGKLIIGVNDKREVVGIDDNAPCLSYRIGWLLLFPIAVLPESSPRYTV
ncbi:AlbA family DNA-binding domain-containing protein [Mangrovibacterium lignilyticum]|uniref:AlbA family DNA-binding domain-containing protein n=1 Tax=Mangrovibacterium lignilyticum TaxID=2668052 RepID=UPI0037446289